MEGRGERVDVFREDPDCTTHVWIFVLFHVELTCDRLLLWFTDASSTGTVGEKFQGDLEIAMLLGGSSGEGGRSNSIGNLDMQHVDDDDQQMFSFPNQSNRVRINSPEQHPLTRQFLKIGLKSGLVACGVRSFS